MKSPEIFLTDESGNAIPVMHIRSLHGAAPADGSSGPAVRSVVFIGEAGRFAVRESVEEIEALRRGEPTPAMLEAWTASIDRERTDRLENFRGESEDVRELIADRALQAAEEGSPFFQAMGRQIAGLENEGRGIMQAWQAQGWLASLWNVYANGRNALRLESIDTEIGLLERMRQDFSNKALEAATIHAHAAVAGQEASLAEALKDENFIAPRLSDMRAALQAMARDERPEAPSPGLS